MRILTRLFTKELPRPSSQSPKIWNLLFGKYLLVTNTFSSGILMSCGDAASQKLENRHVDGFKIDWNRVSRMFVVGALAGPLHHYFYKWMDYVIPAVNVKNVMKKILLDQFIMSPACIILFFYSAGTVEGQTLRQTTDELKEKAFTVYTADWMVWPPTQFINFYYLPTKYRVGYINFMTMLYNVFLSYIKHKDIEPVEDLKVSQKY